LLAGIGSIPVGLVERGGNSRKVLEQAQHLIVLFAVSKRSASPPHPAPQSYRGIIRNEETQVRIIQYGGNPDQPSSSARDDRHILPRVLRGLSLSVVGVIQIGDRLAERHDAGHRAIFARIDRDIESRRLVEGMRDRVFDLGSALPEVAPFFGVLEETMFVCALGSPDYVRAGVS